MLRSVASISSIAGSIGPTPVDPLKSPAIDFGGPESRGFAHAKPGTGFWRGERPIQNQSQPSFGGMAWPA